MNPIELLKSQAGGVTSKPNEVYLICNKNRVLAKFLWNELEGDIFDPVITEQFDVLPNFISADLEEWLRSRTPPKHREHMDKLLGLIGVKTTKGIVDYSKGLSLTDTLWVRKMSEDLSWDSVNLYENEFDRVISEVAFNGGLFGGRIKTTSPEFGTNGMLPKCWVRESDGCIYLKKGGTSGYSNAGCEPYSEVLASQVLERLVYEYVPYSLEKFRGSVVSSCKLITSVDVSMIPIYMMCSAASIFGIVKYFDSIGCKDKVLQMLIFDYLTLNSDRHANNFAVLVDSNTFEPIKMAPIYDNGVGMLNYYVVGHDFDDYRKNYRPALYDSFEDMARYAKRELKPKHNVNRLIGFKFDRSKVPGYSDEKIDFIERFIQDRVHEFLSW